MTSLWQEKRGNYEEWNRSGKESCAAIVFWLKLLSEPFHDVLPWTVTSSLWKVTCYQPVILSLVVLWLRLLSALHSRIAAYPYTKFSSKNFIAHKSPQEQTFFQSLICIFFSVIRYCFKNVQKEDASSFTDQISGGYHINLKNIAFEIHDFNLLLHGLQRNFRGGKNSMYNLTYLHPKGVLHPSQTMYAILASAPVRICSGFLFTKFTLHLQEQMHHDF